jgi:uncharacterized C2H2 Zn-finger protein
MYLFFIGAKPFECPQCDKSFRTSAHRKSHITSHFKDGDIDRRPKRIFRRINKQEMVPDIPLQEPILITDTGILILQKIHNILYLFAVLEMKILIYWSESNS